MKVLTTYSLKEERLGDLPRSSSLSRGLGEQGEAEYRECEDGEEEGEGEGKEKGEVREEGVITTWFMFTSTLSFLLRRTSIMVVWWNTIELLGENLFGDNLVGD